MEITKAEFLATMKVVSDAVANVSLSAKSARRVADSSASAVAAVERWFAAGDVESGANAVRAMDAFNDVLASALSATRSGARVLSAAHRVTKAIRDAVEASNGDCDDLYL